MTDYSKTKIYKIESHLGDKIYIGSTAKQYLSQRFQQHKSAYKQWKNGKCSKITSYELFDEYGVDNCQIVLIEEYPCNNKDAKNAKESHYIRELQCVNKYIPGRTGKQYYEDNKDKKKQYQEDNRDHILERQKQYYEENKDKSKQYYKDNKDHILEKKKQHYENNKDHILEKKKKNYEQKKAEKLEQPKSNEVVLI
jgi:hypothetical protein